MKKRFAIILTAAALSMTGCSLLGQDTYYIDQGMEQINSGNYEEALQHAEAGLALSDDRAKKEIAFNQAVCYEYLGQYEKALELFRSYEEQYGQDEKADHEIAFLVTR